MKVRDPVHNFIRLRDKEAALIDTRVFQRLRGIRQLAMANHVYPGALHTRFDHSLGVMHVAGAMAQALPLTEDDVELVRLAALLHDIGHGPFSHVSEHSLNAHADRNALKPEQKKEKIHELISAQIIRNNPQIVQAIGARTCEKIIELLQEGHGPPILKALVSGPLDADKQDYLLRDSHFCGAPYGVFDIHQLHRSLTSLKGESGQELAIRPNGVHAVEQYVLAKYYLTTNVYRHKVRLITDQMIIRAIALGVEQDKIKGLQRLYAFDGSDDFVTNYMEWDDARFMQEFCLNGPSKSKCKEMLERLRERRLLKRVFSERPLRFTPEVRDILMDLSPEKRSVIEQGIAEALGRVAESPVDPASVILHIFDIRSVKEMSRNDEGEILVIEDPPERFSEASTLFNSINERYSEESVDVYAPVDWKTETDKHKTRRDARDPIMEVIETECQQAMEGDEQ